MGWPVLQCRHLPKKAGSMQRFGGCVLCFLLVLFSGSTLAQSGRAASITFKGSFVDTYLFRGHVYNPDEAVLADLGIGIASWSYNVTAVEALDSSSTNALFVESEQIHNVSYTTVGRGRITTYGYQYLNYDDARPDTQEFFMRVAHNTKWNPTYGVAFDIDTYKGYYFDVGVTRLMPLTRRSQLLFNLRGGLSYDMDEKRNSEGTVTEPGFFDDDGINHASAHAIYVWQPANWVKLETGIDYHHAFDDVLYDDVLIDRGNTVWKTAITLTIP